jgi:hypothetical protein
MAHGENPSRSCQSEAFGSDHGAVHQTSFPCPLAAGPIPGEKGRKTARGTAMSASSPCGEGAFNAGVDSAVDPLPAVEGIKQGVSPANATWNQARQDTFYSIIAPSIVADGKRYITEDLSQCSMGGAV